MWNAFLQLVPVFWESVSNDATKERQQGEKTMIATRPENDLHSLHDLAAHFQVLPGRIERAAAKLGVGPALRIDGRPYYDDRAAEKIRQHLSKRGAE
jgi:hypothetical protein